MSKAVLVKKLLGEVGEMLPEATSRAARREPVVNIGLAMPQGGSLAAEDALMALERIGVKPVRAVIHSSDTEPTLVAVLPRSLTADEANSLSSMLGQEAIAQVDEMGRGDLYGPQADLWKPFNPQYFLDPEGKRLHEQIMNFGDEEKPGFAGGGPVIRKATEGILDFLNFGGDKAVREAVVNDKALRGDGRKFKDFFADVTSGKSDKYKPSGLDNYDPAIELGDEAAAFRMLRDHYSGNFDNHIKTSIPGFDEVQNAVGSSLLKTYGDEGADILDIGSSEGALIKALSAASDGRIRTTGVDPNPDMLRTFRDKPQAPGSRSELAAFGSADDAGKVAWTEGDGTDIRFFDPGDQRYDAAHEAMVFQFISNARRAQAERMKELLKPKGIAIFEEKFGNPKGIFDANEAKKDAYKSKYYTPEQMEIKRKEVLQTGNDAVEGMTDLQVSQAEMEEALRGTFSNRAQFWDSGNFKGYAASDDKKALEDFLNNLQPLDSEYATTKTPRGFAGGGLVDDAVGALKRWYHGTEKDKTFDYLDPLIKPANLGLHVGTPEQANNFAGRWGLSAGVKPRVIPLDVDVKNPLRLKDINPSGLWQPHEIYDQLARAGKIESNSEEWARLRKMMSGDELEQLDAMMEAQQIVKDLGHDSVVYLNRAEGLKPAVTERIHERLKDRLPEIKDSLGYYDYNRISDDEYRLAIPEVADSMILFSRKQFKSPFGEGPGSGGYADGGRVLSDEEKASMTHEDSYGYGERPVKLESLGETWEFDDAPYYARADGESYSPSEEGLQLAHDMARLGIYATGPIGVAAGTGMDLYEGVATGDPLNIALAAAGATPGKVYKAVGKAAMRNKKKLAAAAAGSASLAADDAEAGIFGKGAKWARSSAGRDAYEDAYKMYLDEAPMEQIQNDTNWFRDIDRNWKFELPSDPQMIVKPNAKDIGRLGGHLYDRELFNQYPGAADIKFRRMNDTGGFFNEMDNEIVLGDTSAPFFNTPEAGGKLGALIHEVEHWKQGQEGWARGSNTEQGGNMFDLDMLKFKGNPGRAGVDEWATVMRDAYHSDPESKNMLAHEVYSRAPGEVTARRAAKRRKVDINEIYDNPAFKDIDRKPSGLMDPVGNRDIEAYLDMVDFLKARKDAAGK